MPRITVNQLDICAEAAWSFREALPTWRHRQHGSVGTFDPFPAYPHELNHVEHAVRAVQVACPPRWDVELFVADREEQGRSNGYSNVTGTGRTDQHGDWVAGPPVGLIMLSGKRVPPHPAVTRYLVAHEYGHNVEWMLQHARGHNLHGDDVVEEYARLRGLASPVHAGTGGRWHDSATEIFACDFRIIVCDIEADYWPHPGTAHPADHPLRRDLWSWWARALTELPAAPPESDPPR